MGRPEREPLYRVRRLEPRWVSESGRGHAAEDLEAG